MQANSFALTLNAAVAVALFVMQCADGVRPPSTVYVNKCCRADEWLNDNHQCIITTAADQWWPIIYMIKKQSYFEPHGSAPRFFKATERAHPYCAKPEFIYGPHSVALFSNGSLYVHAQAKFIGADDFCVDKDVAIVCDPDARRTDKQSVPAKTIKLRKCCGRGAIYRASENMCAHTSDTIGPEQLVVNATNIEFVSGFPDCKVSKYFTMAEEFDETSMDGETGRLVLRAGGRKLDAKSYCLEYVHDGNASVLPVSSVHVFTCADHLSASLNDATDIADTVNWEFFYPPLLQVQPCRANRICVCGLHLPRRAGLFCPSIHVIAVLSTRTKFCCAFIPSTCSCHCHRTF